MTDSPRFGALYKFCLTLLVIGSVFWLGGLTMRAVIANEFFIPGTLTFDPDITLDQERTLFQLIEASTIIVVIAYAFVLLSAIGVLKTVPLKIKENGWILMAALLFFLFVPSELFTGYLDVKYILLWERTKDIIDAEGLSVYVQHSSMVRETLSHRIGALSGIPVIALLSYYTAILIVIWQPLRRRTRKAEEAPGE